MAGQVSDNTDEVMGEINMIPFIDVMLVLLIVFIITVPVMKHSVTIELLKASNEPEDTKPQTLSLVVQADGAYFIDDAPVPDGELSSLFAKAAARNPQPDLHIRGDKDVRYERVAKAMAAAQQAGLKKIGFITEPEKQP